MGLCQVIGKEEPVRGDLGCGVGIVRDDTGKEPVVFPEADALSAHAFPVDHTGSRDGELDGPGHGIFGEGVIVAREEEPGLPVRQVEAELKACVRIRQDIPHDCIVALVDEDVDAAQLQVLAQDSVVKIPDPVMEIDLGQVRAVVKGKGADGDKTPGQGEGPQTCLLTKSVGSDLPDRRSSQELRHLEVAPGAGQAGDHGKAAAVLVRSRLILCFPVCSFPLEFIYKNPFGHGHFYPLAIFCVIMHMFAVMVCESGLYKPFLGEGRF